MFDPYINERLSQYYRYKRRDRKSVKLGFPSETLESRMWREGVIIRSTARPEFRRADLEANETGKAIAQFTKENPTLGKVCEVFYSLSGDAETKAKMLGICKASLYSKVGQIHQKMYGYLNDVIAEG